MRAESSASEAGDSYGFLKTLSESLKSHVDVRLKSPFAGAFVLAWLSVNWKPILILLLSRKDIEERIADVSTIYFDTWTVLGWPLILAAAMTIAFYLLSLIFLALFECYAVAKAFTQRQFDHFQWVSPAAYIGIKERNTKKIQSLTELATDNLKQVEEERNKAIAAEERLLAVQQELSAARQQLQQHTSDAAMQAERAASDQEVASARERELVRLRATNTALEALMRDFTRLGAMNLQGGSDASAVAHLRRPGPGQKYEDVFRSAISLQAKLVPPIPMELLQSALAAHSLETYTNLRYPLLNSDPTLQAQLLKDISSSGIHRELTTVKDLDEVVERSHNAVLRYSLDKPEFFKSGTDFISKSLGFVFKEFRDTHGFGGETRLAFERYKLQ